MSPEQLSAAAAAAIMVAISAVLLALVALRRGRDSDEKVHKRLAELQQLLDQAENRIARLERARDGSADDAGGQGRPAAAHKADEIASLAGQGVEAVEIARRMNIDVGEVELMINLQKCRPVST